MQPAGRLALPRHLAEKLQSSPCGIVLTGGGGWVGQATLEMLEGALGDDMPKRVAVFGSAARPLKLRSGRAIDCRTLNDMRDLGKGPKFFLHYAFLTKDRLTGQGIESFVEANGKITDVVAAAIEGSDTRGLFALSSGAVYKKGTHTLDSDLEKNAYGVMKIADEKRFSEITDLKKTPFCMPRLFNLSGPFINKHDLYALASMIACVLEDQPIVIKAPHKVVRSYIHVADLVALGLAMLLDPQETDEAIFDTSGAENMELGELAESVRKVLGRHTLAIHRPPEVEGRDDVYVGDGRVWRNMLQAHGLPLSPMEKQIRDTAGYMQECASVATGPDRQ